MFRSLRDLAPLTVSLVAAFDEDEELVWLVISESSSHATCWFCIPPTNNVLSLSSTLAAAGFATAPVVTKIAKGIASQAHLSLRLESLLPISGKTEPYSSSTKTTTVNLIVTLEEKQKNNH